MFQKTPKILLSHILPITLLFILSQTIHSSLFSPTVNFTVLHHIHLATLSLSIPSAKTNPHPLSYTALPTTRLVSLPHQSTLLVSTSTPPLVIHNTTWHRSCSRLYPSIYHHSGHYTKYLLIYLLVCMFACSCCIVIGTFVLSHKGVTPTCK